MYGCSNKIPVDNLVPSGNNLDLLGDKVYVPEKCTKNVSNHPSSGMSKWSPSELSPNNTQQSGGNYVVEEQSQMLSSNPFLQPVSFNALPTIAVESNETPIQQGRLQYSADSLWVTRCPKCHIDLKLTNPVTETVW